MARKGPGAVLLLGGALSFFLGCGGGLPPPGEASSPAPGVRLLDVPFLPQEEETCGPSSLAMVLRFFGRDAETAEIVRETRTGGLRGTLITDLADAARRRGLSAEIEALDLPRLRETIRSGVPAILLVDLGRWVFSRPHYLVAYGLSADGVVAHSGMERGKVIPFPVLDRQWERMGRLSLILGEPSR